MPMNRQEIETFARMMMAGELPVGEFADELLRRTAASDGIADVGAAQVDLDRQRRCGFPEVVFAEGKAVDAIRDIFAAQLQHQTEVFATRLSSEKAEVLLKDFPQGRYNETARTFRISVTNNSSQQEDPGRGGRVVIMTAGTSDLPVAEEARETALWAGANVTFIQDVGVAGPHRLRASLPLMEGADAVVVAAGMEGALPSVVGGHVACPIIAVPTSVGYGASFGGLAALLGMLNSCASNVTVVNIDAGFKGGYVAGLIARNAAIARGKQ
jgi:pyridinium-3,5-biscarboxylic acid mononucleotide synthase